MKVLPHAQSYNHFIAPMMGLFAFTLLTCLEQDDAAHQVQEVVSRLSSDKVEEWEEAERRLIEMGARRPEEWSKNEHFRNRLLLLN